MVSKVITAEDVQSPAEFLALAEAGLLDAGDKSREFIQGWRAAHLKASLSAMKNAKALSATEIVAQNLAELEAAVNERLTKAGGQPIRISRHLIDPSAPNTLAACPPCNDLRELAKRTARAPAFIIDDWLPVGYATLFAGHGGVGKSGIALHLAVCIALGRPFFSMPTKQRRVLYLSCEDRIDVLHWRLTRICSSERIKLSDLHLHLDIIDMVGRDSILYARDPITRGTSTRTPFYEALSEMMRALRADVLVVDGISDTFGGNENSKVEVKQFVNSLIALVPSWWGAVLLIGHVAKPAASTPNTSEGYSGTTGWHNAARARWYLYPETEPGDDWSTRPSRTGNLVLELQKSNYGASDQAMRFRWDDKAHLLVGQPAPSSINPAQRAAIEAAEKQGILDAGRAAISKGLKVPAAMTGPKTALHVLSAEPAFPASLKGARARRRFQRLLNELRSAQVVQIASYRNTARQWKECLDFK